jgi:hypothetical protein
MLMIASTECELIAATSANDIGPSIAISATRANYRAAFDLEYVDFQDCGTGDAIRQFMASCDGHLGIKIRGGDAQHLDCLAAGFMPRFETVILAPTGKTALYRDIEILRVNALQPGRFGTPVDIFVVRNAGELISRGLPRSAGRAAPQVFEGGRIV